MELPKRSAGEIEGFDVKPFLQAAELLARSDEPERALKLLDLLPAYYRDNIPTEAQNLRDEIKFALLTPHAYASVDYDSHVSQEASVKILNNTARGQQARALIADLNTKGKTPHIVDMGPGEYWLPIGLYELGFKLTYEDISLLQRTGVQAREIIKDKGFWHEPLTAAPKDQPYVFIAYEIIEHLYDPMELSIEAIRHGQRPPDHVLLSTPMYCFDGSLSKDWRKLHGQAHMRAYTPQEFYDEANRIFRGYDWEIVYDQVMVVKGKQRGIQ